MRSTNELGPRIEAAQLARSRTTVIIPDWDGRSERQMQAPGGRGGEGAVVREGGWLVMQTKLGRGRMGRRRVGKGVQALGLIVVVYCPPY